MKKMMILGALLISAMTFAQKEPKLEAVGNQVKATYYYDNGQIQQQGFFTDGKPDGKWIAYDASGNKKSVGEYNKGQKSGTWIFWDGAKTSKVEYSNNQIALVSNN